MKNLTFLFFILINSSVFSQELTKNVYFDVDEYKLSKESKEKLDQLVPLIKNKNIQISGFADSTASVSYNLELSKKRAKSVSDYLISKGINSRNMKPILAKGESTNAPTFDKNRRVSIDVYNINSNNITGDETEKKAILEREQEREGENDHLSKTKDGELNQETIENISVGEILNIGGLEFHPGRHFLKSYSLPVLDKLTNVLSDNPTIKIEIQGHICCQPSGDGLDTDTGTRNLSENRAEQVYIELIKRGVSRERLTYKGYGSSRKLVEEINGEAMQRNRRVSILIIEK